MLAKHGIVCYTEKSLNQLLEDVSEWSVPSRFEGFARGSFSQKKEKPIWALVGKKIKEKKKNRKRLCLI